MSSDPRTLTQAELMAEAKQRFGDDPKQFAFVCPQCGDVAKLQDFIDIGADPDRAGQECIGRSAGAGRGCKFAAYGLIPGPWTVVIPGENGESDTAFRAFALAPAPERPKAKQADLTISPYGRGTCPEPHCGRDISLTKKGVLRVHGREKDLGNRWQNCPGSGKAPASEEKSE